jgi:hypothetical protein
MSFLQTIRKLSFSTELPNRFAYPPAAAAKESYAGDHQPAFAIVSGIIAN